MDTIKDAVTCMLGEVPQTTSIEARFASIEDSLKQVSSIPSTESRSISLENLPTIEVANELNDRQRRKGNLILHNVPETENQGEDEVIVSSVLTHVLGREFCIQNEDDHDYERVRVYRLGRREPGRTRSIKCHLRSEDMCEQILMRSRRLTQSHEFCQVVLQPDMTFLQRTHIKQLVKEKKRRNSFARENNEEEDWIIRDGKLYRKRDIYV